MSIGMYSSYSFIGGVLTIASIYPRHGMVKPLFPLNVAFVLLGIF